MTAMRLKRYPSPSGGFALGKMGVGATLLKQGKTARDYVQDGLVAMWDGIENAGWGVHDPNATTWVDLSGNGYDATLGRYCSFGDNYCATDGGTANIGYATARTEKWIDDIVRIEAVGSSHDVTQNVCFVGCNVTHENGITNNVKGIGIGATDGIWTGKANNGKTGFGGYPLVNDKIYSISTEWASSGVMYVNGEALTKNNTTAAYYNAGGSVAIFGTGYTAYKIKPMKVFSIRLYSRALPASEIAANYAIDKERFNLP